MKDLVIGDQVLVSKGEYSNVIGFTHRDSKQVSCSDNIVAGGNVSVELVAGDYLSLRHNYYS